MLRTYDDPSAFAAAPLSSRGLDALEYLLFYEGADNACSPAVAINSSGSWAALGTQELAARKAAYARVAAADVAAKARALSTAWQLPGTGFLAQLSTAGKGSALFATTSAALDAVAAGLFYIETMVKDRKLAQPLGMRDCTQASCPEALEGLYSASGRAHLQRNLAGFKKLFVGCAASSGGGLGFDDLLNGAGAKSVADRMGANLAAAEAALAQLTTDDLVSVLDTQKTALQGAHDAVKRLIDDLKGDFVLALQIKLPGRVAGDND